MQFVVTRIMKLHFREFSQAVAVVHVVHADYAIPDRRTAIARAVSEAGPRDVILVAGKGHEDYQEVAGVRLPFSDVVEARAALIARAGL